MGRSCSTTRRGGWQEVAWWYLHHRTDPFSWFLDKKIQVATIGIYVQTFFCYRLWIISKKNTWFIMPIIVILLFAYISSCVAVRHALHLPQRLSWILMYVDILYLKRRWCWPPHCHMVYVLCKHIPALSSPAVFFQLRRISVPSLVRFLSIILLQLTTSSRWSIDSSIDGPFPPTI